MARDGRIARFGVFEVDLEAGELRKSGIRIKLQDQPFQILAMLLDRPGEIVTREDLRNRLWPNGTFVDFDHSLNASINKLRDALGDTASNARFIETIPRRGYRFIAPIERPQPVSTASPAPEPAAKRAPRIAIAGITAAVLIIVAAGIAAWRMKSAPPEVVFHAVPLTSSPGWEIQPSFSPDGNYVVYAGGTKGPLDLNIYVKQIGSEAVRLLTSDPAPEWGPKWSPDARQIAFVRVLDLREPATAALMIVPALGGAERKLGQINAVLRGYPMLDWFPDSENMVIADAGESGNRFALYGLNTRTNERWRLTTPQSTGHGDVEPAVSPDGRRLAFIRHIDSQYMEIYVLDLGPDLRPASEPRVLTPGVRSGSPAWTPNGLEIVYTAGTFHRRRLWRVQASPGSIPRPIPLASEGSCGISVAISRRSQLAYLLSDWSIDIFRTDLAGNKEGVDMPFLNSTAIELLPEYSPDGKRIAFVSTRSGSQQIWLGDSDGSNAQQLTFLTGGLEATWPRWSPDGRRLLFTVGRSVYEVSVHGGPPAVRLKDVAADDAVADWSRDGKWIYFISNRTGTDEIWKTRADIREGDETMQITRTGAKAHRTSYDGRFIYYAKGRAEAELWRVPAGGGREQRIIDRLSTSGNFATSQDKVYFIPPVNEAERASLVVLDNRTQTRKTVASLPGIPMWGLTVSHDGRYTLHSAANMGGDRADLMLVQNFR